MDLLTTHKLLLVTHPYCCLMYTLSIIKRYVCQIPLILYVLHKVIFVVKLALDKDKILI